MTALERPFSFRVSRQIVASPVHFSLVNRGEDAHDFSIRSATGSVTSLGDVTAGDSASSTQDLPAGDYVIFCALPGHEVAGMLALFSVR